MSKPTVDVIIPTYRPDQRFCLLLQRLQEQTFLIQKLIIVNTEVALWDQFIHRYKEGKEFLTQAPYEVELLHIPQEEFDHGATRRLAVNHSTSDYFICMTQDAVLQNEATIEELMRAFQKEPKILAVYARQLPNASCNVIEQFTRSFNYPSKSQLKRKEDIEKLGIKTFFCSNVCAAYNRSIYNELGGFIPRAIFNEDMILAGNGIHAGYFVYYAAQALVEHSHNYSGIQQIKRNFDLAVSQRDHPEIFAHVKSESEGIRMVKLTAKHLLTIKKPWLIFDLIYKSGCKLAGYKLGFHYQKLSRGLILKLTMNKQYWRKLWQ